MLSLISFIILIGVLITAHEFGHFIVAKLADVKVHTFSVGFGRAILSKQIGETEYRIAWIPLGGYVRLQGMEGDEFVDLRVAKFFKSELYYGTATEYLPPLEADAIMENQVR